MSVGVHFYPTVKPRAERMAVRVVRAMLMITLHLFLLSGVIVFEVSKCFKMFQMVSRVPVRQVEVFDAQECGAEDEELGNEDEDRT